MATTCCLRKIGEQKRSHERKEFKAGRFIIDDPHLLYEHRLCFGCEKKTAEGHEQAMHSILLMYQELLMGMCQTTQSHLCNATRTTIVTVF
ncbi:hypothetical protein Leryth_017096 [Lithospermum erythrorhizon]|nr:hypothetical protein Leryth_017096 [Lithospermum erythrorhizon]